MSREPSASRPLRALTYLAPGIPLEFFERVSTHLGQALGRSVELESESRSSGPMHEHEDPFRDGRADIGFLCSPSYLYLRALPAPTVELVPAAFVFTDLRADGQPVYFSDVVVRADHRARSFEDLAGGVWGYNDECSLSGYFATLQKLSELGCGETFFGISVRTGSHFSSIERILAGELDGAAVDSNVLTMILRRRPALAPRLRVVDSWGPFPIQPVVVRRELGYLAGRLATALLELESSGPDWLQEFGLKRCVPTDETLYAQERRALCELGQLTTRP